MLRVVFCYVVALSVGLLTVWSLIKFINMVSSLVLILGS